MKTVMQSYKTGELKVIQCPPPQLKEGHVLIRTAHSLISAGTEKTKIDTAQKSLIGKAQARPDLVRQVITKAKREGLWKTWEAVSERLSTPLPMGYSSSGIVLETLGDVGGIRPGDRVACAGNHAEIVCMPKNLVVPIPGDVPTDQAAFTVIGSIAMQGVRQADVRVGEKVVVIGLGLVGLLTTQILAAAGCSVFGIDVDSAKTESARSLGCNNTALATDEQLEEKILLFTEGYGADCTIITAGSASNKPIEQAGEFTREKGRVVVVGASKMDIPREPFYLKELEIRMSRSYGPGRYDRSFEEEGKDYPYAYVRFTERRNMSSFLDLVAGGAIQIAPMITHRFRIDEAAAAYDVMRGERKANYLGIVLEYDAGEALPPRRVVVRKAAAIEKNRIRLGVIGAGKYATANLFPHLRRESSVVFGTVCTSSGLTAVNVAERFGFESAESDPDAVIADSDAVLIATRHHDHAGYAVKALKIGKPVFVEKPLVINSHQLEDVVSAAGEAASVMVGFNRRFAPAVQAVQDHLPPAMQPRQVLIRINAGAIPLDHWIQDPNIGGGRLIGEGCHFVDLAAYLCGARIQTVHAAAIPQQRRPHLLWDNFSINLSFANGSVASIVYTSIGDSGLPKEQIEVFAGGKAGIIRDFTEVELWSHGRKSRSRSSAQDKGQEKQVQAWVKGLRQGSSPIAFESIVNVHQACLAAIESIGTGGVVKI